MKALRHLLMGLAALFAFAGLAPAAQAQTPARCTGKFVNPITDICWSCMFPLSIGGLSIWPSTRPDTGNPSLPVCACGSPIPVSYTHL